MARVISAGFGAATAVALLCAGVPAHAAGGPVEVCNASGDPASRSDKLSSFATRTEALMQGAQDRVVVADQIIDILAGFPEAEGGASEAGLAAYCAVAGEAFRLGRKGNASEARLLLEDALRHAETAGSAPLVARAAYRLALVGGEGTAAGGSRGLKRSIALSPGGATAGPAPSDDAACASLGDSRTTEQGPTYYSAMALECARNQAIAAGDPALAARSAYRLARVWLNFSRRSAEHRAEALTTARGIAVAALAPAGRIADRSVRVALTARLAEAALDADQGADSALDQAVESMQAASVEPADLAATHALRGRLSLIAGNRDAALRDVRQAILLEQQVQGVPWRLADWYVLLAAADSAGRLAHLASALRALDAIRPLLGQTDTLTEDSNFVLRIRPVFEEVIGAELEGDDGDNAERIARVQGQVEDYRQAELQSLLGSECVPSRPPIRPEELRAGEVLLYPVLLPDRIELIYASGDEAGHASYHRLPPIRDTGRAAVLSLVDSLTDGTSLRSDNDWRGPSRRLYALLIAPVEALLKPGGTLVIVPDGQLSALPFAALLDSRNAFLVQRSRLAVVPSLAFAQPAERSWRQPVVLAVTLERAVVMPAGTFKALTGTANEAQVAVGPSSRSHRLIHNFRRADLENSLSRGCIDILHVATHADFNGRSDRSYIVADGETVPIGDLRAMIARSETRGNQLDLIVLSACETAVGDDQADMGLAGAAVQAGARSAVASLWSVNDLGTTELMKAFYGALRKGEGKAEALHEAQLSLIARGDEFSDPNVWAAFTLLGGWR